MGSRTLAHASIVIYLAAIAVIAFVSGEPTSSDWWRAMVPFYLWICAPIAAYLFLLRHHAFWIWIGMAGAAISIAIYCNAIFGPGQSSTSALVFAALPLYQWVIVIALLLIRFVHVRVSSR